MAVAHPEGTATNEISYEQYLREFHSKPPTLQPYEILDGVRFIMNSPLLPHQRVTGKIFRILGDYEETSGRGIAIVSPFDIVIRRRPKLQTRQPDVLFISSEQLEQAGDQGRIGPLETAPELVVEVISPSETKGSLRKKIRDFQSIGVKECWIVRLETRTIEVLRLTARDMETVAVYSDGQTLQSLTFPDLTISLTGVFTF